MEEAKVSKLKRKCLERDQLLTKLLLKLQKKRGHLGDEDDGDDAPSITSSVQQIEDLLRSETENDDYDELASVQSLGKKDERIGRPSSALIRSLSEPRFKPKSSPGHRIFVAKKDHNPPAVKEGLSPTSPVTHS